MTPLLCHGSFENRIADDQGPYAALPARRDSPREARLHEDLPSHRVSFAEPLAVLVQQLPGVLHELPRNLQLQMRCDACIVGDNRKPFIFERAPEHWRSAQ